EALGEPAVSSAQSSASRSHHKATRDCDAVEVYGRSTSRCLRWRCPIFRENYFVNRDHASLRLPLELPELLDNLAVGWIVKYHDCVDAPTSGVRARGFESY